MQLEYLPKQVDTVGIDLIKTRYKIAYLSFLLVPKMFFFSLVNFFALVCLQKKKNKIRTNNIL